MAHLAALSHHVYEDVLADSKSAPDGHEEKEVSEALIADDDIKSIFDAFINNKAGATKASSSVDVSTDSGSASLNKSEDHQLSQQLTPLIQEHSRLSVF